MVRNAFDCPVPRPQPPIPAVQLADTGLLGRYRRRWRGLPRAVPGVPRTRADRMAARAWLRAGAAAGRTRPGVRGAGDADRFPRDRRSVVWGQSVSVRVDLGVRVIIKKK